MSRVDVLIARLCPDGVALRRLGDVVRIRNGRDYKHHGEGSYPVYGSGGIMTRTDGWIYDKPSVLIPRKGSLSNVYFVQEPFWTVDTIFYTEIDDSLVTPKFLYYVLLKARLADLNQAGGVPSLTQAMLNELRIAMPPLEVQREIVRALDTFSELEAELEAEMEARRRQYEHYRDSLLAFSRDEVRWVTLGEIGKVSMCRRIFKEETAPTGDIPFFKIGTFGGRPDAYISRETYDAYRQRYPFPKVGDVLISAAGTIGRRVAYDGEPAYFQDSNIVWIDNLEDTVLNRFLYYVYEVVNWETDGGTIKRLYNENLRRVAVPVPSIDEQLRIAATLDVFNALVSDLSIGLPAELVARRKQYEHYRDRLLTFKELAA